VEELVEAGTPNQIHIPGIFVQRKGSKYEKELSNVQ
jgi:acyl CoA:acetate/3-ketoacid CoA transferase alpha subunit